MKDLKVWTASTEESAIIVEEMKFEVLLSNGKKYMIWNKTEVNGMDRYYLSKEERDSDIVPKLMNRISQLEDAIKDRLRHKALTLFIENDAHLSNFFGPLEKVLNE